MRRKFYLDKRGGKLMGVCAGLADYTGIDALWIRIATVLIVLAGGGMLLPIYVIVGLIADSRPAVLDDPFDALHRDSMIDRGRERDIGLAEIENYYATSNPRLSREIDGLR